MAAAGQNKWPRVEDSVKQRSIIIRETYNEPASMCHTRPNSKWPVNERSL